MVWLRCLFDLFGEHTLSGWAKPGWAVLLIFVPWVGALIYLIARDLSMTERQMAKAKALADHLETARLRVNLDDIALGGLAVARSTRIG